MTCPNAGPMLDAYVDNELDLSKSVELEKHLESCPECADRVRAIRQLHSRLSSPEMRRAAPEALRARVSKIPAGEGAGLQPHELAPKKFSLVFYLGAAAALIILAFGSLSVLRTRGADQALAAELVSAHVRSLMVNHLLDVPSSDQHTVKPWFHGRLDYAPQVVDLASSGYPLAGGRLDYIAGRPVAVLVYQRRQHPINVFEWPTAGGDVRPHNRSTSGYNLVHWNENGMEYWAVSDLNYNELAAFVELLRKS